MDSVWFRADLADEILKNDDNIFNDMHKVITDIICGHLEITQLIENMSGVLTNKEPENRAKGMKFFTGVLKELPKDYLNNMQLKFISKFYTDRLKDNHRVIPFVLEGYLCIIQMANYEVENCGQFVSVMFREVPCQSQVRSDRYNIYLLICSLFNKDVEYLKSLGPDFVYGVITTIDGERDPRNLMFIFSFLPKFLTCIPVGHLVTEMFEIISCYYPIDFHASPDDPAAVTRQDLANALAACLCAISQFADSCLVLLIEKLDSSLRLAKLDSLKLLSLSCQTFPVQCYVPFLKTIWSSIQREMSHKSDDELKLAAHEALSALVKKMATTSKTDQVFENFVKGIIISMQSAIAESATVAQFNHATKTLLTVANASQESCAIIVTATIPALVAYYGFKTSSSLQIASLNTLGDLANLASHWEIVKDVESTLNEIPQLCLIAVSDPRKEYQIAGFKTLNRVMFILNSDLVLPFVEVLIHNIQTAQDDDLIITSVEAVHALGRKYPELIMDYVVRGKFDLENLTRDKAVLKKRLDLLCNLASIDEFTKVIIEEMLKIISATDKDDAQKVVKAMSTSISNSTLYSKEKVAQVESDHGLVDSIIHWLLSEMSEVSSQEPLEHGYVLISNTMASLPEDKQEKLLAKHTCVLLDYIKTQEVYFLVLESLYESLRQSLYGPNFKTIMAISLKLSLESEQDLVRKKACVLIAHFLNKANYGDTFDSLYVILKEKLATYSSYEEVLCPFLITLCGWLTKALLLRGSELYLFWLNKIILALSSAEWCENAAEAINLVMSESQEYLQPKCHCRTSLLYKQRMYQDFMVATRKIEFTCSKTKEAHLMCWAYILKAVPRSILINEVDKISSLVITSLDYNNKNLLLVMLDVLIHLTRYKEKCVSDSIQSIIPRLIKLSTYEASMDVRIKSLECLYEIANTYPPVLLLPYKYDLLYDITPSLDDCKRLVRNMAVRARTRWFLLGSPGEVSRDS